MLWLVMLASGFASRVEENNATIVCVCISVCVCVSEDKTYWVKIEDGER